MERLVTDLAAADRRRLPSEDVLSEQLGVSRATLRTALAALEQEGKVTRVHGVGTLINRYALRARTNLAEDRPFLDLIAATGAHATLEIIGMSERELAPERSSRLELAGSQRAVVIERVYRSSGAAAVHCRDHVPTAHLRATLADLSAERSTFAFLERWTGRKVRYSVTEIVPTVPAEDIRATLGLEPGTATLLLDHLHVDELDEPIALTEAYVVDPLVRFSAVRSGVEL